MIDIDHACIQNLFRHFDHDIFKLERLLFLSRP
jgi:hypothetical protein